MSRKRTAEEANLDVDSSSSLMFEDDQQDNRQATSKRAKVSSGTDQLLQYRLGFARIQSLRKRVDDGSKCVALLSGEVDKCKQRLEMMDDACKVARDSRDGAQISLTTEETKIPRDTMERLEAEAAAAESRFVGETAARNVERAHELARQLNRIKTVFEVYSSKVMPSKLARGIIVQVEHALSELRKDMEYLKHDDWCNGDLDDKDRIRLLPGLLGRLASAVKMVVDVKSIPNAMFQLVCKLDSSLGRGAFLDQGDEKGAVTAGSDEEDSVVASRTPTSAGLSGESIKDGAPPAGGETNMSLAVPSVEQQAE
jgi:hypothetical protein